jgi:hypothetical protein
MVRKGKNMKGTLVRTTAVLLLGAVMVFAGAIKAGAEVNEDYALKISLESQLEKKLKQVIIEITGTDKVVLFINAELVSKGGGDRGRIEKKSDALVLPGVPAKKEFGTGQSSELLLPGAAGKFSVSKIIVSIWIDKSVPESIIELIKDISKNVIGFNQNRGDQIDVKKVDFEGKGFFSSLIAPPNLFWLILSLLGGFMLLTTGLFFLDPLKKVVPALKEIDWSVIRGTGGSTTVERTTTFEREVVAGPSSVKPGAAAGTGQTDAALPFSFVRERDIASLAFLLKDRTPQDVAIVANYLDPALAIRLFESLPQERQIETAVVLGKEEISMDKVVALEELVKSRLAYVVGGESKLISLLDVTDEEVREKVVAKIEARDVQSAARLKRRIRSIETIILDLPAQGIQTLFRNVDVTLLAQILKTAPADVQQKVITSLSAGAAERLKQEMDLSRPLSAARLKRERQNLMALVRRLINEGLVEVENS